MTPKSLLARINNLFSRGKMLELHTDTKVPTAKAGLMAEEIYDGLEYPQDFGMKSYPPQNSEIISAHFGGNRKHGTILKAFNRDIMPGELEEGETVIYNGSATQIKLNKDDNVTVITPNVTLTITNSNGNVDLVTNGTITLDAPTVVMTGDLLIDGTINGTPP